SVISSLSLHDALPISHACAQLVEVAGSRRRAAHGAGVARRMLAVVTRAVAGVGGAWVSVIGAGRARGILGVRRAVGAVPRAEVGEVALADRRTAERRRGQEGVVRTRRAAAGTRLGGVADAGRRAARGPGVPRRVLARLAR